MAAATRLHRNLAGLKPGKKGQHLGALELLFKHGFALRIGAVYLKDAFCQVHANCCNLHVGRSFVPSGEFDIATVWHVDAGGGRGDHSISWAKLTVGYYKKSSNIITDHPDSKVDLLRRFS